MRVLVVFSLPLLVCASMFARSLFRVTRRGRILVRGEKTTGVVLDSQRHGWFLRVFCSRGDRELVEFRTQEGHVIRGETYHHTDTWHGRDGLDVAVSYLPNKPQLFVVTSGHSRLNPFFPLDEGVRFWGALAGMAAIPPLVLLGIYALFKSVS
ncbi:MAG: hypothetical protein Q4G34_10140 [Micrococcus sp.]|nr:hypothetical protein [Micrococcus sp.]